MEALWKIPAGIMLVLVVMVIWFVGSVALVMLVPFTLGKSWKWLKDFWNYDPIGFGLER